MIKRDLLTNGKTRVLSWASDIKALDVLRFPRCVKGENIDLGGTSRQNILKIDI